MLLLKFTPAMELNAYIKYHVNNQIISTNFPISNHCCLLPELKLQISITINSDNSQRLIVQAYSNKNIVFKEFKVSMPFNYNAQQRIFCNGFQSWTESDEYPISHRFKAPNKLTAPFIIPFGDYFFYSYKPNTLHSFSYSYIRPSIHHAQNWFFIGSLAESSGYTIIEHLPTKNMLHLVKDLENLHLSEKNTFTLIDVIIAKGTEQQVFNSYFNALQLPALNCSPAYGFTTWYNYYTNINQNLIQNCLQAFVNQKTPIQIFQIDDGWQTAVGDWLSVKPQQFENGMEHLTTQIHHANYKAGLWLAPFMCQKNSVIYKKHKNWLLKTPKNYVKAGYNLSWNGWTYVLDFYNPEVKNYLTKVFDTILNKWNFDMVKLDFLYCAAMYPPPNKTRGQVMHEVMTWLKQIIGNKIILACGVPLASAFGLVDYCRVGADVHHSWDMKWLKWLNARERPSTINTIKNTIHRRQLNGKVFYNDPDVSILRNNNTDLTDTEKYTLFIINQLFGSLQFISDNINEYSSQTLQLYNNQFLNPVKVQTIQQIKQVYIIFFTQNNKKKCAYCNLSNKKQTSSIGILQPHQTIIINQT